MTAEYVHQVHQCKGGFDAFALVNLVASLVNLVATSNDASGSGLFDSFYRSHVLHKASFYRNPFRGQKCSNPVFS